jgi:hypothetical protein
MVILHGRMLNGWKSVPQQRSFFRSSGASWCIHPRLVAGSCKGRTLTHPSVKGGENRAAPAVASKCRDLKHGNGQSSHTMGVSDNGVYSPSCNVHRETDDK